MKITERGADLEEAIPSNHADPEQHLLRDDGGGEYDCGCTRIGDGKG